MSSKKVRLEICGSSYVVSTNDSEEYLLELAERLDEDMKKIMLEAPNASVTSAAVISALGYLDEASKSAFGADNMRAQIQDYLEDAAKAKMAAEEARREVERLRRELSHYEKKQTKAKAAPAKEAEPAKATEPAKVPAAEPEKAPAPAQPPKAAPTPTSAAAPVEEAEAPEDEQLEGQIGLDELD